MPDNIGIERLTVIGRADIAFEKSGPMALTFRPNFAANDTTVIDFTTVNQGKVFGVPRAVFVNNGTNPSDVDITLDGSDQVIKVPAYAIGTFKVDATASSKINFTTTGGATGRSSVVIYNYDIPYNVWYSYGAFNTNRPMMAQGAMASGATVAAQVGLNNPVFMGGVTSGGVFTPVRVDALGRLDFATSITVGGVFGSDPMGAPPVNPGFGMVVLNSLGNRVNLQLNANGEIKTKDTDVAALLAKANTGTRSTVASAVADTLLLAANANAKGRTIYNDSTAVLYVALGSAAASAASYTTQVAAGGYYEVLSGYTGEIRGIWAAANGNARVTEIV